MKIFEVLKYKLLAVVNRINLSDFNFMVRHMHPKEYAVITVEVDASKLR